MMIWLKLPLFGGGWLIRVDET